MTLKSYIYKLAKSKKGQKERSEREREREKKLEMVNSVVALLAFQEPRIGPRASKLVLEARSSAQNLEASPGASKLDHRSSKLGQRA